MMIYLAARRLLICMVFLTLWLIAPVWAQDAETALIDLAYINRVTINDDLTIDITGELGDACTALGAIEHSTLDHTIVLRLYTIRPAEAMCAMQLQTFETTVVLDTAALTPGDKVLLVNGTEYPITVPETIAETAAQNVAPVNSMWDQLLEASEAVDETPITCSDIVMGGGLVKFENDTFCFLHPAGYSVMDNETLVLLTGATHLSDRPVMLVVEVSPANGIISLDDLQAAVMATYPTQDLVFETVTFAGLDAIMTDSIMLRSVGRRQLFTLWQEQIITLQVNPVDDNYDFAAVAADDLWSMVTATWHFVED